MRMIVCRSRGAVLRACVGVGAVGAVGPLPAGRGSAVRLGSALTAVWESRSVSAKSLNLCKDGCEKNTKACEKVSSKRNTSRMATTLRLCRHAARRPRPHGWRLPDRPLVRRRRRVHISTRPRCSALSRARLQRPGRPPAPRRDVRPYMYNCYQSLTRQPVERAFGMLRIGMLEGRSGILPGWMEPAREL